MKLMLVLDRLHDRGGSAVYLNGVTRTLARHGVVCFRVYGRRGEPAGEGGRPAGGERRIHNLESRRSGPWDAKVIQRLGRTLETTKPACVVVQNVMNPAVLAFLADVPGAVLVVQDHRVFCPARGKVLPDGAPCRTAMGSPCAACFEATDRFEEMFEQTRTRLSAALRFRRVVVLSAYMKQELTAVGFDPAAVSVIPPASTMDPPTAWTGGRTVAVPGRIAWQKGGSHLLDALARKDRDLAVTFIGDGPMRKRLERKAEELGISARVDVVGWVEHGTLRSHMLRCVCAAMPSLWAEPFGLAGMEAASLGMPVLAFDVGGITEWLEPGKTGVLVPPADFDGMLDAVTTLLADRKRLRSLGDSAARRIMARFTPQRLASSWMETLNKAAGR